MIILVLGLSSQVFATTVINEVSTSASTGEGGKTNSYIKVLTEIDGEVVENIEKEHGQEAEIEEIELKISLARKILNYVFSLLNFQ